MSEFKLEEKWCIEVTKENSLIVGEYFKIVSPVYVDWWKTEVSLQNPYRNSRKFLRSHNDHKNPVIKESESSFSSSEIEGQLLTTEQFIKYVLNKEQCVNSEDYKEILIKLLNI